MGDRALPLPTKDTDIHVNATHTLQICFELYECRYGNGLPARVSIGEVNFVPAIGPERSAFAASLSNRTQHIVADEELPIRSVTHVTCIDLVPRYSSVLAVQVVTQTFKLFFPRQGLFSCDQPLLLQSNLKHFDILPRYCFFTNIQLIV